MTMVEYATGDVVLLHLAGLEGATADDGDAVRWGATIGGISEAVGMDAETMAARIELLSTVEELVDAGLVTERTADVVGESESRRVYLPTAAGLERAAELRDRLEDERVRVRTAEGTETVRLGAVDEYFEARPLVSALVRETDGVVRLDDAAPDEETGLVDRTAAVDEIEDALSAVADGASRVLSFAGEPGVGKTALADEATRVARARGFAVATGKCNDDVSDPHEPFAAAFADLPGADGTLFEGSGDDVEDQETFEAERQALFYRVRETVEAAAADGGLVLVIDDVHWADEASADLLSYLLEAPPASTLLLVTYRSEGIPETGLDERLADRLPDAGPELVVEPFGREHTTRLVERLLGVASVPETFATAVYDHTGGNPLFVEETVELLRERGRLDPSLDVYPEDFEAVSTPERAREAIAERLGPLDGDVRRLLEYLAVVGGRAAPSLLAAAASLPSPAVRDYLSLLIDAHVLERTDDGVRFASDVVRETVRDRLDEDRRRELHAELARAYTDDEVAADGARDHGEIARHYELAGDADRAIEYYRQAAEDATDAYAHSLAVEQYGKALDLARDDDESRLVSVAEPLARVHYLAGEYDEARRYCRYVRQEADDDGAPLRAARIEASVLVERGEYETAWEVVETALDAWDESPSEAAYRLLATKARLLREEGSMDDSEAVLTRALSMARSLDDPTLIGGAQRGHAAIDIERGEMDAASSDLRDAVATLEGTGARRELAEAVRSLGNARWWAGDLGAAREAYERTLELAEEMDDPSKEATAYLSLAITAYKEGEWDRAMEHNRTALDIAEELGLASSRATVLGNVGELQTYRGDLESAREHYETAIDIFEEMETVRTRWKVVNMDAKRQIVSGDLDAAEPRLRESRETLAEADIKEGEAEALELLGRLHRERGALDEAREAHREALSLAEAGGSSRAAVIRCELARDHRAAGDHEDAVAAAERARESAVEMNDAIRTLRADLTLGGCYRAARRYDDAAAALDRAMDAATDTDADYFVAKTRYELGLLARDRGETAAARDHLRTARSAAAEMGVETIRRRADEALTAL